MFPRWDPFDQFCLISPLEKTFLGMDFDWGKVNYSEPYYIPHVNGIVVYLRSKKELVNIKVGKSIDIYANKILKAIRCKYPYAIDREYVLYPYTERTKVKSSRGLLAGYLRIQIDTGLSKKWIEFDGVINTIRNINKEVSLPLQLYDNALESKSVLDYRACILYSASLIEILLKRDLERQLEELVSSERLRIKILEEANGYDKIWKNLKTLSCPSINVGQLINKRNRIIHGGYSPYEVDAQESLDLAAECLEYYKVDVYE